jgi:hypothetical protein
LQIFKKFNDFKKLNTRIHMHKNYLLTAGLVAISQFLSAETPRSDVQTELEISQGYRRDNLTWNISGYKGHPNILSELKYKRVNTYTTRVTGSVSKNDYFVKGMFGYGAILSGRNSDTDYLRDNRRDKFSQSVSSNTGDFTIDSAIQLGKHFHPASGLTLSPSIGYSIYTQKFRDKHGREKFIKYPAFSEKNSKLRGLNSTYHAKWYSPRASLRAEQTITPQLSLFGEYSFLYPVKYRAKGYWNLRKLHFRQYARSQRSFGNIGLLGAQYQLSKNWSLKAECEMLYFLAKGSSRGAETYKKSPIREVTRTALEGRLSLSYAF